MPTTTRLPCHGRSELFEMADGERTDSASWKKRSAHGKALCGTCPRLLACRDEGRAIGAHGIWGGEDENDRITLAAPAKQPADCGSESGARRHRRLGETVCTRCHNAERIARLGRKAAERSPDPWHLSPREAEVLIVMDEGAEGPTAIARVMGVTPSSVSNALYRLRRAFGVPTEDLLQTARSLGILPRIPSVDLEVAA